MSISTEAKRALYNLMSPNVAADVCDELDGTLPDNYTVAGTLGVTGAATLSSTLAVTGATTPTGGGWRVLGIHRLDLHHG